MPDLIKTGKYIYELDSLVGNLKDVSYFAVSQDDLTRKLSFHEFKVSLNGDDNEPAADNYYSSLMISQLNDEIYNRLQSLEQEFLNLSKQFEEVRMFVQTTYNDLVDRYNKLLEQLEGTAGDLTGGMESLRQEINQKLEELRQQHNTDISTVNETINTQVTNINNRIDQKVEEINNRTDQKIEEVNNKIDREVEEINNKIDQEVEEINNRTDQKIEEVNDRIDQKIEEVNDRITSEVGTLDQRITDIYNELTYRIDNLYNYGTELPVQLDTGKLYFQYFE